MFYQCILYQYIMHYITVYNVSLYSVYGNSVLMYTLYLLSQYSILSLYEDAEPAENAKEGAYLLKDRKIEYTAVDESRDTATMLLPSLEQLAV